MLGTSLVVLCTFQAVDVFFVRHGLHACSRISRCVVMYAPYSVTNDCLYMCLNDLFTMPIDCLASFEAFWFVCNSMHNAY